MTLLTELPPEIIQHVLVHVAPQDLASVPQVCKALSYAVRDNAPLYKAVYLAHLDTPPPEIAPNVQWEQQLKDFVRLQVVCGRKRVNDKKKELPFVYDTVTTLLRNATTKGSRASTSATHPVSRNAQVLASLFADETSQAAFLCRSSIYERARAETIYKSNSNSNIRGSNGGRNNSNGGAATGGSGSDNSNDSKDEIIEQDPRKTDRMRSAKLHCLYGKPVQFAHPESHRTRQSRMRPFACSRVYDLRQYTPQTQWGPFMGGSGTSEEGGDATLKVDWEMVEAIMLVLGANLEKLGLESFPIYKNFWATPFAGVWPNSYMGLPMLADDDDKDENGEKRVQCENCSRPISMPPQALRSQADDDEDSEEEVDANGERKKKRPLDDPYGINGTWLRVVCFLDYNDFFAYNFAQEPHPLPADVPRPAIDVGEATRLILMKIAVTEIEEPGPDDGQDMPVVHFRGISRSLDDTWDDNANSDLAGMIAIRGTVRMTKEGEVRWTTVSIFGGIERWKSESVQVGGVKSSRGVLGNWFDRDYDPRGPVGPTAFWKISDRIAASNHEQRVMLNDFLPIIDVAMDEDYEPITDDEEDEEDEDEDDQEGEDDDDEAMDHSDGDGEEAGDGEMTEADEAAQAAFLASLPEIEIIDGTDIEIIGSQIIWTERD